MERSVRKVSEFSSSDEVQSVIRKRQRDFEEKQDFRAIEHYIITKYPQDRKPLITASNTMLNFGFNPLILDVVNSYLGHVVQADLLRHVAHVALANTIRGLLHSAGIATPRTAGRSAPFFISVRLTRMLARWSTSRAAISEVPTNTCFSGRIRSEYRIRPTEKWSGKFQQSQHVILKGPPGTLVFCDTAGFHRGGISKTKPRILATSAFVTPASLHRRRYEIDATVRDNRWSPPARFAVM